jgi:hypothetical protein
MEKRQPYLIVVCGKKASGKTYTTIQMINEYVHGDAKTGAKPRKVLILDINGEFTQFKTIPVRYIAAFSMQKTAEIRRVTIFKDDGSKMTLNEIAEMLKQILDKYRNGLLLVEDVTRYISDSLPNDVIGAICTQRHLGVDIILHFQMLGKAGHPKILANLNMLRLHKVTDPIEKHKKKFEDYYALLKIGQLLVNIEYEKREKSKFWNKKDKKVYFWVFVDMENETIRGQFTREMFSQAVHEYVNDNERETVGVYLKKRDTRGNHIYNYEKAYSQVQKDLFADYYGNPK